MNWDQVQANNMNNPSMVKHVDRKPRQQWVANIHQRQLRYKNVMARSVKCLLKVSVYTVYLITRLKISWDKIINDREFEVRSAMLYCVGMKPYCSIHINIVLCTIKFSNNLSIVSSIYTLYITFAVCRIIRFKDGSDQGNLPNWSGNPCNQGEV